MNRTEAKILRETIKAVTYPNKHLWLELKRQILDLGHQNYYSYQDEFKRLAKRAVCRLQEQAFVELKLTYSNQYKNQATPSLEQLIDHYTMVIVEEIVRRATIAAYRTENW